MRTFLSAVLIGLIMATIAYAGTTATLTGTKVNGRYIEYTYAVHADSTGAAATKISVVGVGAFTHAILKPSATTPPSVGTVVKVFHPTMTATDLFGGAITTTSTTTELITQPYLNSQYQWSAPFNGDAVIDVSGNTTADAAFDLLVGIFIY